MGASGTKMIMGAVNSKPCPSQKKVQNLNVIKTNNFIDSLEIASSAAIFFLKKTPKSNGA
jgi:hypothetical protein